MLREIHAASRRIERESYRRRRDLERKHINYEKMAEFDRVRYEVELYENQLELLLSVHKECGTEWNWQAIQNAAPPLEPILGNEHELHAGYSLARYTPSISDRFLFRSKAKRKALLEVIDEGKQRDLEDYQQALQNHNFALEGWEYSRQFASRILAGDLTAYHEAIREANPFNDLKLLGSSIQFMLPNATTAHAVLRVNSTRVIPSEIKTQLKTGRLSVKPMPKASFFEVYQDYVCGCVLRVARELFALLPLRLVLLTAIGEIFNSQNGNYEEKPVLSVAVPRLQLGNVNWNLVDPSDAMNNFVHRMCFKKGKGLFAIVPIELSELQNV
jgi:hypothetical protein